MLLYALRRTASLIPIAFIVLFVTFTLGYFGPIDPVRAVLGEEWEDIDRYKEVEHALGLDRPFLIQFRYPTRMLIFGALAALVLGGVSLDSLWRPVWESSQKTFYY